MDDELVRLDGRRVDMLTLVRRSRRLTRKAGLELEVLRSLERVLVQRRNDRKRPLLWR